MGVGDKIRKRDGPQRRRAILPWSKETNFSIPRQAIDFGWRLRGSTIHLLADSSLTLLPVRQRATAALLTQYCADGNSLLSCLQCGACSVNCHLAENDGALFPRRQMTLLQLGEVDRLLADPSVWLCFNCQESPAVRTDSFCAGNGSGIRMTRLATAFFLRDAPPA